jgi:mannose PTS system EIIA component
MQYSALIGGKGLAKALLIVKMGALSCGATKISAREECLMIGLVLVTHGRLAIEFRAALEHVVGPQQQIESVTIGPDDDVEQRRNDIIEAIKRVDSGDGVAVLTDMFGGTPSNLSISCMNRPKVEVVAGINLPMLVKLAKVRADYPLPDAVIAAQEAGRKYVTIASRVLAGK